MFWNTEFLDPSSHIDVLLQMQSMKLSDILYEDDLLQELKTSNVNLTNFLIKPEVITELVDNITQLTRKDCCVKLAYSKVHAAYISCEILTSGCTEVFGALMKDPETLSRIISCLCIEEADATTNQETETETDEIKETKDDTDNHPKLDKEVIVTKVVPQKATLVSKLINHIHTFAATNLSCHITKDIETFPRLINVLIQSIDVSGAFDILSTFISSTIPTEPRYVFCEVLSKCNFVFGLIDVMTLSDIEDKQRNACQLLCDIILTGRQDANQGENLYAQDMLLELLESKQAVHVILKQMFSEDNVNSTAIVCGLKVLQALVEQKFNHTDQIEKTMEKFEEEIEQRLSNFHELLTNPPQQEPIKTTFGVIQKPLGYMRLEVVIFIRALISTNSRRIIRKLVELRTMKVIIDLFIDYSWNNLLHTQVEQALCLIIRNYRRDEELNDQPEVQEHSQENGVGFRDLLSQLLNECDLISRLLLPKNCSSFGEKANFGHIIQMINSIAINCDLDTIQMHLNEMKEKRPELYDRWTTFLNVDVASFKGVSLYYDAQSAVPRGYTKYAGPGMSDEGFTRSDATDGYPYELRCGGTKEDSIVNKDSIEAFYDSFSRETVIPSINADVLPKLRRFYY